MIWPRPAEGQSRKWLREDPWKQWLKNGATTATNDVKFDQETLLIVQDCLKTDPGARPSKHDLEVRLLEHLSNLHKHAFDTLTVTLAQFDQIADESKELGWPYYADRLRMLNDAFSD